MKKGIRINLFIISALFAVPFILCRMAMPGYGLAAEEPILIGVLYPMTGPVSATGDICLKGVQSAVDQINADGGIKSLGGRKLKLIVADSEGKPEVAVSQTERLIRQGVVGLLGTAQSSTTYPATASAERQKVPFLVSSAYADPITERGFKYTFRYCVKNSQIAPDMLAFVTDLFKEFKTPLKTAVSIMDDTIYGKTVTEALEKVFGNAGIKIIEKIFTPVGSKDLNSEVMRAKKANADVVLTHEFPSEAILLIKTMKELGFLPKAIVAPGGAPKIQSYYDSLGKLSDYVYVLNETNWDVSERSKKINKVFRDRYGIDLTGFSMFEYIGIYVWRDVLEKAGSTDREKIRNTFATIEITSPDIMELLPYGKMKFGPDGQNYELKETVAMVKDATLRTVWPPKVASIKKVFPLPPWGGR